MLFAVCANHDHQHRDFDRQPSGCDYHKLTGGSVVVTTQAALENNDATSAAQFANMMKNGNVTLVFGTGYGSVTVDPNSVTTGQATNPASTSESPSTFSRLHHTC